MDPMTGDFSPQQYLAENTDIPYFTGVQYNNAIEKPEAVLELTVTIADSLNYVERSQLKQTWKYRFDYAGYPVEIIAISNNKYQFHITGVFNPVQVESLITDNVWVGLYEINCSLAENLSLLLQHENQVDSLYKQRADSLSAIFTSSFVHESAVGGFCLLNDTAKVIRLLNKQYGEIIPANGLFAWQDDSDNGYITLYCLKKERFGGPVIFVNDYVKNIELVHCHDCAGLFSLHIQLNVAGVMQWKKITANNAKHPLAIAVNGKVNSEIHSESENDDGLLEISSLSWDKANNIRACLLSGTINHPMLIEHQKYTPPVIDYRKAQFGFRLAIILGYISFILFTLFLYMASKKIISLAINRRVAKRETSFNYLFIVTTALFLCIVSYMIIKILMQPIDIINLAEAILLSVIALLYLLKKKLGWFLVVSWLNIIFLLAFTCFFIHLYDVLKTTSLNKEIFLPTIVIPSILIVQRCLFLKQIRQQTFGLTDKLVKLFWKLATFTLAIVAILALYIRINSFLD